MISNVYSCNDRLNELPNFEPACYTLCSVCVRVSKKLINEVLCRTTSWIKRPPLLLEIATRNESDAGESPDTHNGIAMYNGNGPDESSL